MAEKEEKSPITPTLRVMKIGEEFTYPIQMMTSVRTVCTHTDCNGERHSKPV